MRIVIATGIYPPDIGGPATYAKILAEHLPQLGIEVVVVTYAAAKLKIKNEKAGKFPILQREPRAERERAMVKIITVSRRVPKGLRHTLYFWKVLWHGRRADIIYALDPVSAGLPAVIAAKILKKPFLIKIVGDYAWEQFQIKKLENGSEADISQPRATREASGRTEKLENRRFSNGSPSPKASGRSLKSKNERFITLEEFESNRYDFITELRRKIQKFVARSARSVIVPSQYLKRIIAGWGVPEERIQVIYNAVEIPQRLPERGKAREHLGISGRAILSVGRLVPWKGFNTLILLMPEVIREIPDARLFIIGSGPEETHLKERIAALGLKQRVRLVGAVPHEKVWEYLAAADIFVLNSAYEGFSHQLIATMGAGLATVATRVGGNPEAIENGKEGFLIQWGDREALEAQIIGLLRSSELRERMGMRSRKKAAQFSIAYMLDATVALVRETTLGSRSAPLTEIQPPQKQALLMLSHVSARFSDVDIERMNRYAAEVEELHVILRHGPEPKSVKTRSNLFIHATGNVSRLGFFFAAYRTGKRIIKAGNRRLSFTVTAQDPFEHGLVLWGLARKFSVPLELQLHTDCFSPFFERESFKNKIRVSLARFLLPRAERVRVVSERLKRGVIGWGVPEAKIIVRPVWVDYSIYRNVDISKCREFDLHRRYLEFDFIVLMVGRLTKEKNVGFALEALAEVIKRYPKTGLIVAGDGPERRRLHVKCQMSNVARNVFFEGWVEPEILPVYYKTADLYLLTSNYEGYGRSVMEAEAAGRPIVMTDVGVAGYELKPDGRVRIVPVGDRKALAAVLLAMVNVPVPHKT